MTKYHFSEEEIKAEYELIKLSIVDNKHFAPLYERYYTRIFRFINKKVGDEEITADLVSQVFLKVLAYLPKYQFKGLPFSSFLYKCAQNEWYMFERANKKKTVIRIGDFQLGAIAEEIYSTIEEEQLDLIVKGLNQLPPADVQFIELRFFEGLSFKEVGAILGISEGTAKTKTYRIIAKVKSIIQK